MFEGTFMKKFFENLKDLRNQKGITLQQLAEACNVSVRTLIRYEQGERVPDIDTASLIADFFDVSLDYLVGRER